MRLLDVKGLKKYYGPVHAVDGIDMHIERGETLSLVGESGCGKTTASRCIIRALVPTAGEINFNIDGDTVIDLAPLSRRQLRPVRRHMQMIFQDPFSSLNPRMTVGDIIAEPLLVNDVGSSALRTQRVRELLDLVQLPGTTMTRFPHAFSGGQRQRIGIARALALNPKLIVADEAVSALDVSVQAQVVNLLMELQERLGLSYLFVAHDLSVVKLVSDRVAVMYVGRIVEVAPVGPLFETPKHPYTAALLSAVPMPDPRRRMSREPLTGEVADPAHVPAGCAFNPRCPFAQDKCRTTVPQLDEVIPGQWVACHRARELSLPGIGSNPFAA